MIRLIADSSSDRPRREGASYVPLIISTDEKSFVDNEHLDVDELLDYLASYKGRSYTACPSVDGWLSAYEGAEEIYVVTITSSLSGAYNAAMAARELYLQAHPEAKIAVLDTLSTGPEIVLVLEKIRELVDQGLSFEQVEPAVREYMRRTRLFFSLQSLHNLSQNGRVSKVVAAAVGVLGIRIVGTASPEGTLAPLSKCRGDRKALPELIEQLQAAGFHGGKVRITHVRNPQLADRFADLIKTTWPGSDVAISPTGGLCSYYAESGALLVAFDT